MAQQQINKRPRQLLFQLSARSNLSNLTMLSRILACLKNKITDILYPQCFTTAITVLNRSISMYFTFGEFFIKKNLYRYF